MKCYNCGQADMQASEGTYEYDLTGLPYAIVLAGVPLERCPACGEEAITVPDPEGLHRAIALTIVAADRPLLGAEVRFLRKLLDKSAADLAGLMGVDVKTLSRWENGRQKIGRVAERLLRLLVHSRLAPKVVSFPEEVFPQLRDKGQPRAVKLVASPKGWEQAA